MNPSELCQGIKNNDNRALAKAITLIESTIPKERSAGLSIIEMLSDSRQKPSLRIGISGPPGAGKSTLINALGNAYLQEGKKIAVLAIDPSSQITGGSLLGDRTRMSTLNASDRCFIRPSPTKGEMGGVAPHSYDTTLLCEAAGFDIIIFETVGVGQSETAAQKLVDCFVVLQNPGSGDDVQGIKRGILEMSDLVAINKADGDQTSAADTMAHLLFNAFHMSRGDNAPSIVKTSATTNMGISELKAEISKFIDTAKKNKSFDDRRSAQKLFWLDQAIWFSLKSFLATKKQWNDELAALKQRVESSGGVPSKLAHELVSKWAARL